MKEKNDGFVTITSFQRGEYGLTFLVFSLFVLVFVSIINYPSCIQLRVFETPPCVLYLSKLYRHALNYFNGEVLLDIFTLQINLFYSNIPYSYFLP